MDIVINYSNFYEKRVRDLELLKYTLRGIENYMPFIDKVFFIYDGYLPDWLDTNSVTLVKHEDFIPEELLPTYNVGIVEMFMHRIEGLSDNFIYVKEDCLIFSNVQETDFFENDKFKLKFWIRDFNDFEKIIKKEIPYYASVTDMPNEKFGSDITEFLVEDRGKRINVDGKNSLFASSEYGFVPLKKSYCEKINRQMEDYIKTMKDTYKDNNTLLHYAFLCYGYFLDENAESSLKRNYINLNRASAEKLGGKLAKLDYDILFCDETQIVHSEEFVSKREIIQDFCQTQLPNKSIYEK